MSSKRNSLDPTFPRAVSHEKAIEAALALIATHFNLSDSRHSRASIPVQPDDDDIIIMDYIAQQEDKD